MRKTQIAYAAGIFDGEGHVYAPARRRSLYVDICNTDERLIDWLVENFGGAKIISLDKRANRQVLYRWRAYKEDATKFLALVEPYLIIKGEAARAARG